MKVLSVISSLSPADGGPVRFSLDLNDALTQAGHYARIATIGRGVEPILGAHQNSIDIYAPNRPHLVYASRELRDYLSRSVSEFDVVHVDGLYRAQCRYVRAACQARGVPYVVMPHGGLEAFQKRKSRVRKALFDAAEGRRFLNRSSGIIYTGNFERIASENRSPAGITQYVLPIGVSESAEEAVLSLEHKLPRRQHVFLYLGRLAEKKQPDVLLRAWARANRHPNDRLIVAGPDDHYTRDELSLLCRRLGVMESVHFAGAVTRGQASWLYEQAGVFFLPSRNENFGMTISEAMLGGCAVATTTDAAASWAIRESQGGWVCVGSSDDAIEQLVTQVFVSRDKISKFGADGRRFALQHLTWKTVIPQYINAYDQIIRSYRRTAAD